MYLTTLSRAKSTLSKLVEMVTRGEDVVISRGGKPVARLVAMDQDLRPRKGGQWKGRVRIAPDFDDLPEDIARGFAGEGQ